MRFDGDQLKQLQEEGYVVVDCPFPSELTDACLCAVEQVAVDPASHDTDTRGNHHRLKPQMPGSYWCELDHCVRFLQIELHAEIVELARQLIGEQDIYFRNGGINELAPGRSFKWHRDSEDKYIEFMHYFSGAGPSEGCLRLVPGSHIGPVTPWNDEVATRRAADTSCDRSSVHEDDVELDGEISMELGPGQILVRSSRIYHATWVNRTDTGRLMHHWLFREPEALNHRFQFEKYLTDEAVAALTPEQRDVLWLGRDFALDAKWDAERERELGVVRWGI